MEIYDDVTIKTENGDKDGKVMKITETTVKSAKPDMSGIDTSVVTRVNVLVFPDMAFMSVNSDKLTVVPKKAVKVAKN